MKTKELIKILQETKHDNVVIDIISETGHIFNNTFKIGQDDEKFNLEVNINDNEVMTYLLEMKTYKFRELSKKAQFKAIKNEFLTQINNARDLEKLFMHNQDTIISDLSGDYYYFNINGESLH